MGPHNADEKQAHIHLEHSETPNEELTNVVYTEKEEVRVRRHLDLWIVPVLMITYGLQ
jgi:hypothetical protein